MTHLFIYGTLRHFPLLEIVLGAEYSVQHESAVLPDHAVYRAKDAHFPMIVVQAGASAEGLLLSLSKAQLARLDFYEGGFGYKTRDVSVQTQSGMQKTLVYWPDTEGLVPAELFKLDVWVSRWSALNEEAAKEAMSFFGAVNPSEIARRFPVLLTRAQARLNARETAPTTLRHIAQAGDVVLQEKSVPYADFFTLESYKLRHRTFSGAMSEPLDRAAFVAVDAATVLPYDPVRDRVLVIEQFRVGAFGRGDPQPWSLEAIAGRIDPGETPQQAALREAQEEAGLNLTSLIPLGGYYPSPGAKTEFLFSFIGLADLPDSAGGLGGLALEGEDIRAHVISFDHLMQLVETGEAGNAPLILSALHLAQRRSALRAAC